MNNGIESLLNQIGQAYRQLEQQLADINRATSQQTPETLPTQGPASPVQNPVGGLDSPVDTPALGLIENGFNNQVPPMPRPVVDPRPGYGGGFLPVAPPAPYTQPPRRFLGSPFRGGIGGMLGSFFRGGM